MYVQRPENIVNEKSSGDLNVQLMFLCSTCTYLINIVNQIWLIHNSGGCETKVCPKKMNKNSVTCINGL